MYDTRFVEAICRGFQKEPKGSKRSKQLLNLLQAVVLEDMAEIKAQLGSFLSEETHERGRMQSGK